MRRSRAYGPYRKRQRWRIIIRCDGREVTRYHPTEAEATAERDALNRSFERDETALKIDDALAEYERHLTRLGNKQGSIDTTTSRLRDMFFRDEKVTAHLVRDLTSTKVRRLYEAMAERRKVDTHRNTLGQARTFFGWCVDRGYMRRNPAEKLKGIGRRKRGKPQLRIDEAQKLMAACKADASPGAAGTMVALLLGMRASEIVGIVVRDLDAEATLLWIDDAKTAAGRRTLQVPPVLASRLVRLTAKKKPRDQIFPRDRHWLARECKRICRVANVPEVTPHGLRGTHASIIAEQGVTGHVAAQALGHSSYAVTEAHYVDPGATQRGQQAQVLQLLEKKKKTGNQD